MTDDLEAQAIQQIDEIEAVELAAGIVSSFVSNNSVPASGLADLIRSVHASLLALSRPAGPTEAPVAQATPAQIRKSISPDGLISFEDGKTYKALKRHLTTRGMTPQGYRAKYGLPPDYPMTASSYSARRSALAQSIGLGQRGERQKLRVADPVETISDGTVVEAPKAAATDSARKKQGGPRKAAGA